ERKSRKTIGFLADRLHRLAPSPREIGSLLWRRFQHLFRIFAPRFQDIVAVGVRLLLPRRAARSTETSTMASGSRNARAGLAAMKGRNDREQVHQATSDYVAGCRDLVGRGRYSECRRGLRLERHSGRYRGRVQTAGSDLLPDDGHRPVGRLRSRAAITRRYPPDGVALDAAPGASVAAANRTILAKLAPSQRAAIDGAVRSALSAVPTARQRRKGSRSAK